MRRADFSSRQCSAGVGQTHPPSSVVAQSDANDSPDHSDPRAVHAKTETRGITHFGIVECAAEVSMRRAA